MKKQNYFEDLIDQMMIDEVSGINLEIKSTLENLTQSEQRLAILSILDQDRRLFLSIKNIIKSHSVSKTEHIRELVQMLREYVRVGKVEKKKFGEVMTPIELVEEMLDTLPKEVWSNPELKWLDPANGVGTFPSVVVLRLMEGLKDVIVDEEKRYKHIIENMIYVSELQPKNMFLYLCAFDPNDEYLLNIFTGSFLSKEFDEHMKSEWGIEKFDVIVMNPPYQEQKEGNRKTQILWDKFVIKTIDQLKEEGYLVAVHPDGWRNLGKGFDKVKNVLKSKKMLYLELHNDVDGQKTFGAQTAFDFYCLHNVPTPMFTKIKFQDGSVERADVFKMQVIPNGMYGAYQKLVAKEGEERVKVIRNSSYHHQLPHMAKEQNDEFQYPCVYNTVKDGTINFWYSNTNNKGHFGIPKIIWSNGGATTPVLDINGEYGVTEFSYALVDEKENLVRIKQAMLNPDFIKMMKYSNGTKARYNTQVIELFRKDFWKEFI